MFSSCSRRGAFHADFAALSTMRIISHSARENHPLCLLPRRGTASRHFQPVPAGSAEPETARSGKSEPLTALWAARHWAAWSWAACVVCPCDNESRDESGSPRRHSFDLGHHVHARQPRSRQSQRRPRRQKQCFSTLPPFPCEFTQCTYMVMPITGPERGTHMSTALSPLSKPNFFIGPNTAEITAPIEAASAR